MYVTPEQMRQLEQLTDAAGVSYAEMMERAGNALARILMQLYPDKKQILLLAGTGNNGGDCYVAARHLNQAGWRPEVLAVFGEPKTEIARNAREQAKKDGIPIFTEAYDFVLNEAEVVVDGLFGTGFKGELPAEILPLLRHLSSLPVVACDVPSGGNCLTGQVSEGTLQADVTVTFGAMKLGMSQYPLRSFCGDVFTANIGIPEAAYRKLTPALIDALTQENVKVLLPSRRPEAHKNDFGHVLVIAGSVRMRGACVLAATAAMRSGAGLLTCATAEAAAAALCTSLPEAMSLPLLTDDRGFLTLEGNADVLREAFAGKSAILLGCGLGITDETKKLVQFVLAESPADCPVILDADGLNIVSGCIDCIPKGRTILTPHPGEAARLLQTTAEAVQADRPATAKALAERTGAVVILKGAGTIVTDGTQTAVCSLGNPGMARAGSGDVLAGITAAFAAAGIPLYHAACAAVALHAAAGDAAAAKYPHRYMLPQDCIAALQEVL